MSRSSRSILYRWPVRSLLALALLCTPAATAWADTGVNDQFKQQAFQVSATVGAGCRLGQALDDPASLGTIAFGQHSMLPSPVDAVSVAGGGSIVFQCTPNTPVQVKLGAGNAGTPIGLGRRMQSGPSLLRYQLYQDAGRNTVWGDGANGAAAMSVTATGAVQVLPVYARLFAQTGMEPGLYTDTVAVTVTY